LFFKKEETMSNWKKTLASWLFFLLVNNFSVSAIDLVNLVNWPFIEKIVLEKTMEFFQNKENTASSRLFTNQGDGEQEYEKKCCKEKSKKCVTFKDVVGMNNVLIEVREIVDFLKNPKKFKKLGAKIPKGILLEGPPGNGKTLIAKAIANEAEAHFFYESASSFVNLYVGAGAKKVRELFKKARNAQGAVIIFIDELDAIGAVSRGGCSNDEYRQTLNQLLCELDGFNPNENIIVLAATNYAKVLDLALVRSGRFDRKVRVLLPNYEGRLEILKHYVQKLPLVEVSDEFLSDLSKKADGLCASDLENLVNEAALLAVREKACIVTKDCFIKAQEKIIKRL
jgi:cell division protease FtsH